MKYCSIQMSKMLTTPNFKNERIIFMKKKIYAKFLLSIGVALCMILSSASAVFAENSISNESTSEFNDLSDLDNLVWLSLL